MAAGDVHKFDQALVDTDEALHDQENDVYKLGLVDGTTTPSLTIADPRWGAGGTTNFSTDEVTPGGNYSAGGPTLGNNSVVLSGGASVFDADDISIAQHASNPADALYGIIYNDTDSGKRAWGYIELGSVTDLSAGAFSITWNASGIASTNQA